MTDIKYVTRHRLRNVCNMNVCLIITLSMFFFFLTKQLYRLCLTEPQPFDNVNNITNTEHSLSSGRPQSQDQHPIHQHQLVHQLIPFHASNCLISHMALFLNCSSMPSISASAASCFCNPPPPQLLLFMLCQTNQCNFCCHWCLLCSVPCWGSFLLLSLR